MAHSDFGAYNGSRTAVAAGAWTAIVVPQGSRNGLISMEDQTASFRVSWDNALAAGQGHYIAPGNLFRVEGTSTAAVTVYVDPSAATTGVLSYTTEL